MDAFLAEMDEPARPDGLTERELEILALLAGGASNERIARTLTISTRTVERHIGNIYIKIGAHNRAEATAYAFRHELVPPA
jgi:DNA-binding NarL/FixJ family response regulator